MSDYSPQDDKKNESLKKEKKEVLSKHQTPSFEQSFSDNPFVSKTSDNPFLSPAQKKSNPFFISIQKKKNPFLPIQKVNNPPASDFSSLQGVTQPGSVNIDSESPEIMDGLGDTMETSDSIIGELDDAEMLSTGVGEGFGIASSIFTFASGIKDMMDPESDAFDKVLAGFDLAAGVGGVTEQITKLIDGGDPDSASSIIGIVNSSLGAIKNALTVVKQIKKLKDGVEEGAKAQEGLQLANDIAQVGLDIANITKSIYEAVGSTVPGALEQAIPGLGIVMAAIDIIQQAIELAHSVKNYRAMSGFKDDLKTSLKATNPEVFTSDKSGFLGRFRSDDRTVEDELDNATTGPNADSAKEFKLARELKKTNRKRIIRQSALIGADVLTIAGEIATLTGVGAEVGVGLKIGAAGIKGGMKIGRFLKQKYRDSGRGDQRKSSQGKHKTRVDNIKFIFQMIKNLSTSDPQKEVKANRIKIYIEASGANFNTFIKYKTEPIKAAKLLYTAMKKREAGDEVSAE